MHSKLCGREKLVNKIPKPSFLSCDLEKEQEIKLLKVKSLEILKGIEEIIEISSKHTVEKISNAERWFLEKIDKIDKLLTETDSEKNREDIYTTWNENEGITRGSTTLTSEGYYEHEILLIYLMLEKNTIYNNYKRWHKCRAYKSPKI